MSVNKVILVGNLGRDPEMRHTQQGRAVANFTIATNERWKGKDGQQQERTEHQQAGQAEGQGAGAGQDLHGGSPECGRPRGGAV